MSYGLIGEKLGHSYSKIIHEKIGAYDYSLFPLAKEELDPFLKARNFSGLNVTIPYKQAVMTYCEELSPLAREIGAVNTLYFDEQNRLCGTNTDYIGFIQAFSGAGIPIADKKVLILGDGATCRTIKKAVLDQGAGEIIIASRKIDVPEYEELTSSQGKKIQSTILNYKDLHLHKDSQVVINTTPVGMWPDVDGSLVNLDDFPVCEGVFDVIYNPYYTKLVEQARQRNLPHANGLAMLVAQATAAAEYFTGKGGFESENDRILKELEASIL